MADFAAFARCVGRVCRWSEQEVEDLLIALQTERETFAGEDDPLIDLLNEWLGYSQTNQLREVTSQQLFTELSRLAVVNGSDFGAHSTGYKTSRMLTQRLRAFHVTSEFEIERSTRGHNSVYKIRRRLPLSLVSEPVEAITITDDVTADVTSIE